MSIVSLAASSAADIPRGLDFLLMPNRLNVALSRAKWAAYLVYSPALTTGLPPSIRGCRCCRGSSSSWSRELNAAEPIVGQPASTVPTVELYVATAPKRAPMSVTVHEVWSGETE